MIDSSTYPIAIQVLALIRYGGVTPRLFERLFQHYGSLSGILDANATSHQAINGVSQSVARRLAHAAEHLPEAERFIESLERREISISTRFDESYSNLLNELNDPPTLLYLRGKMPSATAKTVTLVGAQNGTSQGIELTTRLAQAFAKASVQVISSLSGGNDIAAHLGAKSAGGQSFGVVDTGFDHLDAVEQIPLAIDIALTGGVVSEYPPEFTSTERALEETDRLLVGLGQAVVVTEVYSDSVRTHDMLKFCGEIGKLTFFVIDPTYGPLADKESLAHAIKCGAIVIEGLPRVDDIIRSLV